MFPFYVSLIQSFDFSTPQEAFKYIQIIDKI
jgi:hypothetical protein